MQDGNDIRLIIEIKNKEPLELLDLTRSFVSLANQFNSYVSINGQRKEDREAKLYVKEIRSGSVIMELVEFASKTALPFVENASTIIGFAGHLKKAYDFFTGKSTDKPSNITSNDYKDLSQIVNPIANDSASQFNLSTTINGNVEFHFNLNSTEANATQNIIEKQIKLLKVPESDVGTRHKVLLTLFQTRADIKAKTGNKGIIEDISDKPLNLVFEDEKLNQEMLHGEFNPYEIVYVVDVIIQHVGGKAAAYKIVKLHETFEKESD